MCGDVLALAAAMIVGSQSKAGAEKMIPSCSSSTISSYVLSDAPLCAMRGSKSGSSGGAACPSLAASTMAAAYTLRNMLVSGALGPCLAVDSSWSVMIMMAR
eukprot:7334233-Prymnesium_polylepis.2